MRREEHPLLLRAEAACVGLSGGTEACGGDTVCLDLSGLRNLAFCSFSSLFVPSPEHKRLILHHWHERGLWCPVLVGRQTQKSQHVSTVVIVFTW